MINNNEFRAALGHFASGVTVVTTKDANEHLHGLTVSAFSSLSLNPPLVLICIQKTTGSHHAFEESKAFVVNILKEDQQNISNHFATHLSDKFNEIEFHSGIEDIPVLENCLANLECRLENSIDGGDHTIFVGKVEKINLNEGSPLIYWHSKYRKVEELV